MLPRTPKDVTLTPINTEGNSVIDTSDCHQDDNGGMEDDKMLFAGLSVSELTSVDNVEDGITSNSMSNLFSEQKIENEPSCSEVLINRIIYWCHTICILKLFLFYYCIH